MDLQSRLETLDVQHSIILTVLTSSYDTIQMELITCHQAPIDPPPAALTLNDLTIDTRYFPSTTHAPVPICLIFFK